MDETYFELVDGPEQGMIDDPDQWMIDEPDQGMLDDPDQGMLDDPHQGMLDDPNPNPLQGIFMAFRGGGRPLNRDAEDMKKRLGWILTLNILTLGIVLYIARRC
eukprot:jgi/Botrbrau1/14262/Bobra.113_2s0008.1